MSVSRSTAQLPNAHLDPEGLQRLPVAEALRQVLIDKANGMRTAFSRMDLNGNGKLQFQDFEIGMHGLGIFVSPLPQCPSMKEIWAALDKDENDRLSLHDLLGYLPNDRLGETCSLWSKYHNTTSSSPSTLARLPGWRNTMTKILPKGTETSVESFPRPADIKARKELRTRLREGRNAGGTFQRKLVSGIIPEADLHQARALEKREQERWKRRVEGHIRECGKARLELAEVHRQLAAVAKPALYMEHHEVLQELNSMRGNLRKADLDLPGGGHGNMSDSESQQSEEWDTNDLPYGTAHASVRLSEQ